VGGWERFLEAKGHKHWDVFETEELRDKTLGLVGCGAAPVPHMKLLAWAVGWECWSAGGL
jgi:hypothetical protein